jgi:Mrp family chromosome partitioning ATPase
LSDALAVATKSDGTVIVCRHRRSNVNEIAKTINTLTFANAKILGAVVNDYKADRISGKYGYYYNYYDKGGNTEEK